MLRHTIAASICTILLAGTLQPAQAAPTVTLAPDGGSLVLESHGEPLEAAIEALAAKAGFSFRAAGSVDLGVPVEGRFEGPVDDVLNRLLSGYDYLVVRGAGSGGSPGPVRRVVVTYAKAVPGKVTPPPPAVSAKDKEAEKSDVTKLLEQQAVSQAKATKATNAPATGGTAQKGGASAAGGAISGGGAGSASASSGGGSAQGGSAAGGLSQGGSQAAAAINASPQLQEQIRATTAKAQQNLQALVEALRNSACPAGGCQPQQ
ncbi:MAG: hypothetical protein B6A08_20215 [Sorangiineae bacterium NIC37A_2]|nr:MAG: hypothetical protein B6A08_20215 [Sorangiineae bacterium NIC37A_2]